MILYGPPASGKDTITAALTAMDERYVPFQRLKCGTGRTLGYRMISADELDRIRSLPNEVLWENTRYGSTYVVDRSHMLALLRCGVVPILHVGQAEAIDALAGAMPEVRWRVVELWCPRAVAAERIVLRKTKDSNERLTAYDTTNRLGRADLAIDTSVVSVVEAAAMVSKL